MTDAGFIAIEAWMGKALAALAPAERSALFRRIGRELAKRNRQHMMRQVGPDGTAWAPRHRDRHGRIRKAAKMMVGLRAARRMKTTSTAAGAEIGWNGRDARIAQVHQSGALDYVDRAVTDKQVRYPVRQLIGLSPEDVDFVRDTIMEHLAARL